MATVELDGRINEAGELEIGKISGLRAGKVHVVISQVTEADADEAPPADADVTWTDEELKELLKPDPRPGSEVVAMIRSGEIDLSAWAEQNITDSVEWVKQQREKRKEARRQRLWSE
jgi:hypothetical protein